MLATESRMPMGLGQAFNSSSAGVQNDVRQLMNSGQYHMTPELCRELKHINNGIDHIKLDNNLLQSSRDWGTRFDATQMMNEKQGAMSTMDKASTLFTDLKNHSGARNVTQMRSNQQSDLQHWSAQNLRELQKDMGPYAHASADRIHQFCDRMGVTDRYTGYRHNLNRGQRDPRTLGNAWMTTNVYNNHRETGFKPTSTRPLTASAMQMGVSPTYAGTIDRTTMLVKAGPTKSIQEQCGINTTFPGRTEYMRRYGPPDLSGNVTGFKINPSPDFYIHGRPLMHLHPPKGVTEHQARYSWPSGDKIPRMPWLRK